MLQSMPVGIVNVVFGINVPGTGALMPSPAIQHFGYMRWLVSGQEKTHKRIPIMTPARPVVVVGTQHGRKPAVDGTQMRNVAGMEEQHGIPVWLQISFFEAIPVQLVLVRIQ